MFVAFFSACAQTPSDNDSSNPRGNGPGNRPAKAYHYIVDVSSRMLGFSIIVNGAELISFDGGGQDVFNSKIEINDWMISGNNKLDITVLWPDSVRFAPGLTSASFRLMADDKILKEFRWPLSVTPDSINSYPYTFSEIFKAEGFPSVLLEKAERVISSAGTLPRADQAVIADIAQKLRAAFTEKNIEAIDELLKYKYADLAVARFTTVAAIKADADAKYRELMGKTGYTVSFNGRNSFFSAAGDKAVRLGQGRIGFPEPAIIITWRESGRTVRWTMELYFAKIDGEWVIIR